jgi:hypothetical protein
VGELGPSVPGHRVRLSLMVAEESRPRDGRAERSLYFTRPEQDFAPAGQRLPDSDNAAEVFTPKASNQVR